MRLISFIILTVLFISPCHIASAKDTKKEMTTDEIYKNGLTAYQKKDLVTALMIWFPNAYKKNHADSQFMLGNIFLNEKAERRNVEQAIFW